MIEQLFSSSHRLRNKKRRQAGSTLIEFMISMTICIMVLTATLACAFFCMRMMEITQSKVVTSDKARQINRLLAADIHSAQNLRLGQGGPTSFSEVGLNTPQKGTALQINPSADTNVFVRYYLDEADKKLKRITNGSNSPFVLASSISNKWVFAAEDFGGNVLTNNQNNSTISVVLQFYQLEDPLVPVGRGQYYQSYELRTRITQRPL